MSDPIEFLKAADIPALRIQVESLRDQRAATQKRLTAEIEAIETLIRAAQLVAAAPAKPSHAARAIVAERTLPEQIIPADIELPPIPPPLTEAETRLAKAIAAPPAKPLTGKHRDEVADKIQVFLAANPGSSPQQIVAWIGDIKYHVIQGILQGNRRFIRQGHGKWALRDTPPMSAPETLARRTSMTTATSPPVVQYLPGNTLPLQSPADRAADYLMMTMSPASAMAIGNAVGMAQPSDMAAILSTDERFSKGKNGCWTLATPPAEWRE